MSVSPNIFVQPAGAATNASNGAIQNAGGANKVNNATSGDNLNPAIAGQAQQGDQPASFSQILNGQALVTVTPQLASLLDGFNIGDEISLDALQSFGISLDNVVNNQLPASILNSGGNLPTQQQNATSQLNVNNQNTQLSAARENVSQQPIQNILARIPNGQVQANTQQQNANIQNLNIQNIANNAAVENPNNISYNTTGQVVRTPQNGDSKNLTENKLADIASRISGNTQNSQQQVQVNNAGMSSNNGNAFGQSLFSAENAAILGQMTNVNGMQTAEFAVEQNILNTASSSQIDASLKAELSALRPTTTAQQTPVEQISFKVAQSIQTGGNKIEIQLDPAHLGKVQVQIDVTADGKANVMVTAEKNETLDMLKNDSRALEQALKNAGLQTDAGTLEFGLKDQSQQQLSQERNKAYRDANQSLSNERIDDDLLRIGAIAGYQSNQALNIFA